MKKIFTLLLTTAMLSTAFAQYGQKSQRDRGHDKSNDVYVSNNNDYGHYDFDRRGSYLFPAREKDMQIDRINHDYQHKIQAVKDRYFMSWFQKQRLINNLNTERDQEIQEVMYKFNSPLNRFRDRNGNRFGDRNKKYGKKNW